jgi:hypothetical protein
MAPDSMAEAEKQVEALALAAQTFDQLLDAQGDMMDTGALPEDETTETMQDDMETARDVCQAVSISMTIAMAQAGQVPDFDRLDGEADGTDEDDFEPTFQ